MASMELVGKLLSPASRAEMMTPQLGSYGTGWFTLERYGHSLRSHTGNLSGFVSVIDRFAEGELTVILLCNIDSGRISTAGQGSVTCER
jgi:hypothetical protein